MNYLIETGQILSTIDYESGVGTVALLGAVAVPTTVSFISLGVSLDPGEVKTNLHPLGVGLVPRMLVVPAIFLPLSVVFGFRNQEL